ncbi:MAG: SH3 domain-containing protein [Lachnospiraceae bacterium]|nr:SH3 domain-containing protein [Lachnospiraceae bacterium]
MNRNRRNKMVSFAIAAGLLAASSAITTVGAPLAGASAVVSGSEAGSYSTLAGINLALANMAANANKAVSTSGADTDSVEATAQVVQTAAEAQSEFASIGVAQVNDFVNVRDTASEEGEVVGKLYNNSACNVEAEENGWYKITSGNVTGYVKSEFVVVGNEELARSVSRRIAKVTADTLYIRKEATTDSSIVGFLPNGDDVTVVDESTADSGWVRVSIPNFGDGDDDEGYVSTEFVALATEYTYAESKEEEEARLAKEEAEKKAAQEAAAREAAKKKSAAAAAQAQASQEESTSYSAPASSNGQAVVNYACQFVGNPYVYGGSSLTNGTDCSGFVMSVYSAFGVGLPHSSSADRGVGYAVSTSDMQPGDIVCYSGHVGIYAGNGTIVHAANESLGITYSNVYYSNILAVRRIF